MSNLNETCSALLVVCSVTSLSFSAFHTYKFDGWRCLVPRRKEWFRVLLTWMLIGSNVGLLIWGVGWSWVKFDLGWTVYPEPYGPMPVQSGQFPSKYLRLQVPLTTSMNVAYSLQTSLNAEEGLYWFHLMRAVRQPRSARNWLNSYYFYAWIVISVICTVVQCSVGWIGTHGDANLEIAQELLCGGILEAVVLAAASLVLIKFPSFLSDVASLDSVTKLTEQKKSGAGPDVRSRLHFYHEANKIRTFFRFLFTVTLLALGIDGRGPNRITRTPMASDLIIQICLGSFFIVLMISMMLYLPRSYSSAPREGQVLIGPQPTRPSPDAQLTSGHALMSLLREGGQWDDEDELRAGHALSDLPKTWSLGSKLGEDKLNLPSGLEHFTSPIAVPQNQPLGPLQIRIEREVHQDV